MTQKKKERLLQRLEKSWQNIITHEGYDLGGVRNVVNSAFGCARVGSLTKEEAQEVYGAAVECEKGFAQLANQRGGHRSEQLEKYEAEIGRLRPFGVWWERIQKESANIQARRLREDLNIL